MIQVFGGKTVEKEQDVEISLAGNEAEMKKHLEEELNGYCVCSP